MMKTASPPHRLGATGLHKARLGLRGRSLRCQMKAKECISLKLLRAGVWKKTCIILVEHNIMS